MKNAFVMGSAAVMVVAVISATLDSQTSQPGSRSMRERE
jgi:hypothetical protein